MNKLWQEIKRINDEEPISIWIRLIVTVMALAVLYWATIGNGLVK